jgi:hypothetical protein
LKITWIKATFSLGKSAHIILSSNKKPKTSI